MKKYINYNDPLLVAEVLKFAKNRKKINEADDSSDDLLGDNNKSQEDMNDLLDDAEDKANDTNKEKSDDSQEDMNDELSKDLDKTIEDGGTKKYFFKNILFFTNERDKDKNKTLKNLYAAVDGTDIEIFPFISEEIDYKATDKKIKLKDNENSYTIDKQSNIDTIVITRLGAQDSEECIELIKELQAWGFFVINPIQAAKKASNKYTSSVLLERYNIPQPKFTLLSKNDIKKGEESLKKKLKEIYPDIGEDEEKDKKREYVLKILDGHGGTGVTMQTGKTILSMLQMIFAVDEERELLLQKKEEADGGDIRVHVLSMRTKQTILAKMKRKKIGGDFRSNVSLGATAEPVELTPEQEEIALKVAKISGMPWCAVDIMPLVKGSNPEIGDNVVLEYNASPGTDGISDVIKENFMKILLDNINDINELVLEPKAIGYIEDVHFIIDDDNKFKLEAKLDTGNGAKASTIGCDSITENGDNIMATINGKNYTFKRKGESNAIVGQVTEKRLTVTIPCIQIGSRKLLDAEFALVDNRKKKQKILVNRDIMTKMGYLVNPAKKHILDDDLAYKFKEDAEKKAKEENKENK